MVSKLRKTDPSLVKEEAPFGITKTKIMDFEVTEARNDCVAKTSSNLADRSISQLTASESQETVMASSRHHELLL
jgi:hypothetical protein